MEFQAVVLAGGRGSRMTELMSGCPKCLLPVGNLPLLWYPLSTLKKAGIQEAIVIVPENIKPKVAEALQGKIDMKLDFATIPSNEDWGTADSLRSIREKLKTDFIVASCDLITDISLHRLANVHRTHNSSLTILLSGAPTMPKDTPGHKSKHSQERDLIGLDPSTGRVIFLNSEADFEEHLPLKASVLKKHPIVQVHSNLIDAHLYIMDKYLLDFIAENDSISTVKGELLPVLIRRQFRFQKQNQDDGGLENLILKLSSGRYKCRNRANGIRCYGYVVRDGFCIRANNMATYMEANRQIVKYLPSFLEDAMTKVATPTAPNVPRSQIGNDCLVGDNLEVAEKVSVKQSVVGSLCVLGETAKITGCVLMDNVEVGEGSVIQGSIVCKGAKIGKQCDLKDCIVGSKQDVVDFSKMTNEVVQDAEEMMEI